MKKIFALLLAALALSTATVLTSCSPDDTSVTTVVSGATKITLDGDTASCNSQSVYVGEDGKITISAAGFYEISGTLNDGQIYVDCVDAGQIDLILNNANITNDDGACIVIKKAQDAVVTLADGSVNTLTDGAKYVFENPDDDEPDAVIFSKEDLTINGSGKLVVEANYAGGIYSKDALKIDGGNIEINSVSHGMKGKDSLVINDGVININAVGDGIKSTNTDSEIVGYIEINGGELYIESDDEAIQAISAVRFNGGSTTIDSNNNGIKCAGALEFNGGTVDMDVHDTALDVMSIAQSDNCTVTVGGVPFKARY